MFSTLAMASFPYPPNSSAYDPPSPYNTKEPTRATGRTPSPTPSEDKALKSGVLDWKGMAKWSFWIRREWLWYYVALVIILVVTALITIFHTQIVHWLTPATRWLYSLKFGWLVPIAILFVISFPPLFGHEIVAILCGLVWGLWIGFAIVCAGTFIGEVGNFYAFKYCCRARGAKLEKSKIPYGCLARVVREGGFKIALIARLSAIPGHFTTAVFSTCGMGIIVFCLAAILSLPKQFITVYLGVIIEQSSTNTQSTKSRIISDVVVAVTVLITFVAMWYIFRQMDKVKPQVIYERRKARQAKLEGIARPSYNSSIASDSTVTLAPLDSDSIPLTARPGGPHSFNQTGYSSEPSNLYAPRPQPPGRVPIFRTDPYDASGVQYPRDEEYGHDYRNSSPPSRESTDEVSWDMHSQRVTHAEPPYGSPFFLSTETVQDGGLGHTSLNTTHTTHPLASPFADPPEPLSTPTHLSGSTVRLSSPYEHVQEPAVSYTTTLINSPAPAPRALSPPPPSYHSGQDHIR